MGDQRRDHVGIHDGAPRCHLVDGVQQLRRVAHPLLQQVRQARRAAVAEQLQRVGRLGVLRQHHHADVRVVGAHPMSQLDALGAVGGRHADVGDHHMGVQPIDGVAQGLWRPDCRDHLDLAGVLQRGADPPRTR